MASNLFLRRPHRKRMSPAVAEEVPVVVGEAGEVEVVVSFDSTSAPYSVCLHRIHQSVKLQPVS